MSSPNVAHALITWLQQTGVGTIYGVTGDALFPLFSALGEHGGMRFIGTTSELSAALMASYHAKVTGTLGVCVATAGPGAAGLVNGLADAYFDRVPVLAITGQVALNKLGTGAKQEIDQQLLFQAVTSNSYLVTSGETALQVLAKAVQEAVWHNTVVHVSIPEDVFHHTVSTPTPAEGVEVLQPSGGGVVGDIDRAASALEGGKKPLIVVGATDRSVRGAIEALADRMGAAVLLAQQAKGFLPDAHPRVLGGVGEAYVPAILSEVDCILQIGRAPFERKYLPPHATMVQLVTIPRDIEHDRTPNVLVGPLGSALQSLVDKLPPLENQEWQQKIAQERESRTKMISEQRQNPGEPPHPGHLMAVLSELVPPNAVIVCDIGAYIHWFDAYFQAQDQTVVVSPNWRSLGSGLPGAIAAALQRPHQRVVALIGDGGIMPTLGELCTAVKLQLPLTIIVANNHRYEIERVRMEHKGLSPFGTDVATPDFAAFAASCGAEGKRATSAHELYTVLQESMGSSGPVLCDVHVAQVGLPFLDGAAGG